MYFVTLKSHMRIRKLRLDRPFAELRRVLLRQFVGNKTYFELSIVDTDGNLRFLVTRS